MHRNDFRGATDSGRLGSHRWMIRASLVVLLAVLLACLPAATLAFTNTKLNGPFTAVDGDVGAGYRFTADGSRVVYLADEDTNGVSELYSANSDGSGSAIKLNETSSPVDAFLISPDGSRVVYRSAQTTPGVIELYSRRVDGIGGAVKLNGPLVADGDVRGEFLISPDSARVVYRADQDSDGVFELYSRPTDGSGAPVKINGVLVSGGDVQREFLISSDSARVVYRADQDTNGVDELYSRSIDASGPIAKLNEALVGGGEVESEFLISADSFWVVYRADQSVNNRFELFARLISGVGPAVRINGALTSGDVQPQFLLSPDSQKVVYRADQDSLLRYEIYVRPIDGSGTADKLNGPLVSGGDVEPDFAIAPDGSRVVYRADQDTFGQVEIFSRALDASGVAVKLNGAIVSYGDVDQFHIAADSTRVVFNASDDLFSRPIAGGGSATQLNPIGAPVGSFLVTAASTKTVFEAYEVGQGTVLYSRSLDGSGSALKLNAATGNVADFALSPTSTRVAFRSEQDETSVLELYAGPVDASTSAVKLNGPLAIGGKVEGDVRISPDGSLVVYRANQSAASRVDVFVRPIDGSGSAVNLSSSAAYGVFADFVLTADGSRVVFQDYAQSIFSVSVDASSVVDLDGGAPVGSFEVSPDSTKVVFSAFAAVTFNYQLYSRSLDGSGSPVAVSGVLPEGGLAGVGDYSITPDSSRVVYVAPRDVMPTGVVTDVFVGAIDGSGMPTKLSAQEEGGAIAGMQVSADGTRVVYAADIDGSGVVELFSRQLDGSGVPIKLNGGLVSGGNVVQFTISPDSSRVVYTADQDSDGVYEIYSRPTDGSGAAAKLNGPMVSGSQGVDYNADDSPVKISPDSAWVVYHAEQDAVSVHEIYSRPIDGSGAAVRLSHAQATLADVANPGSDADPVVVFLISPDSTRVVFPESDLVGGLVRLYSRNIDGSGAITRISSDSFQLDDFRISPNSARVVYSGDEGQDAEIVELYSRPIDGSSSPRKENGTLAGAYLTAFAVSPDSAHVVYVATQETIGNYELWASFRCGDSLADPDEPCDGGECCSSTCSVEVDGAPCSAGMCAARSCLAGVCDGGATAVCGDGFAALACSESCDDGGTSAGNGCAASCQLDEAGRTCLRSIGLQARRVIAQDLKLTQSCFADIAKGTLGCQANQCVLRPSSQHPLTISGSTCSTAADCCPAFDDDDLAKTTAAKVAKYATGAAQRVRRACSLGRGVDGILGNDDDIYVDPQTLGFSPTCPSTFGQCSSIATAQLQSSGAANDLLDCSACVAAATSYELTRFHSGPTTPNAEADCQKALGLQTRKLASKEATLQQKCLDRVGRGTLSCQSNQCVAGADIVAGSICAAAADCCPSYDNADSGKTTQAKMASAVSAAQAEIRRACSLQRGVDNIVGTSDDVYSDPQVLGYGSTCLNTFGQCSSIAIPDLTASGAANDLLECVQCSVDTAMDTYSRFHSGAP